MVNPSQSNDKPTDEFLKDRSELSDLYPSISTRTDNVHRKNFSRVSNIIGIKVGIETKVEYKYVLAIAGFLTIPVTILVIVINFFRETINASNISNLGPLIAVSVIFWSAITYTMLSSVAKRVQQSGADYAPFLIIYSLCALPISQLIYSSYSKVHGGVIDIVPFSMIILLEDIVIVFCLLTLMNNKKIPLPIRAVLLVAMVLACIIVTLANNR